MRGQENESSPQLQNITPQIEKENLLQTPINKAAPSVVCDEEKEQVALLVISAPPDGGWGWMVVLSCFVFQAMLDGTFSVFGVFLPHFLEYYGAGRGTTAVAGSVLTGTFLMSGPFVSIMAHGIGCRAVSIIGGLLLTCGYIVSTLAPNIQVLILTFGAIGGLGLGMIYLPSVVVCSQYFEKKRGLAMGIASSGAGVGMVLLAPLSALLLKFYDWQNALLLISGFMLHSLVFGALLRPLKLINTNTVIEGSSTETSLHYNCKDDAKFDLLNLSDGNKPSSNVDGKTASVYHDCIETPDVTDDQLPVLTIAQNRLLPSSSFLKYDNLNCEVHNNSTSPLGKEIKTCTSNPLDLRKLALINCKADCDSQVLFIGVNYCKTEAAIDNTMFPVECHSCKHSYNNKYINQRRLSSTCGNLAEISSVFLTDELVLKDSLKPGSISLQNISSSTDHSRSNRKNTKCVCYANNLQKINLPNKNSLYDISSAKKIMNDPMLRKDIFYSGSLWKLEESTFHFNEHYTASITLDNFSKIQNQKNLPSKDGLSESILRALRNYIEKNYNCFTLKKMLDVTIITNPWFIVICLSNVFMQTGYFIPIMFLPDYTLSLGIEEKYAAVLMSVFGICNTIGRVCSGAIVNFPGVNSVHVCGISMLLAGLFTVFCALCKHVTSLAICVAFLGLFIAPIIPLTNLFLVQYLGLERLTNSVGLLSLGKGITCIFGPPLAGLLLDGTGQFLPAFGFAGGLFVISGFINFMLLLHKAEPIEQ